MSRTWDERFLSLAKFVSQWSKDPSTKVGAVIANGKIIVSLGFNGFPSKIPDDDKLFDRSKKYPRVVHAEMNAILFAKRDLTDHSIYTYPLLPCDDCAKHIVQTGITRVISPKELAPVKEGSHYRKKELMSISVDIFNEAGVEVLLL